MLEMDTRRIVFKYKQIWFADCPYDIRGYADIMFWECKNKVDMAGFRREEHTTLVIDLTKDLNAIWENMSSGNCRKAIRRAERAGVKIKLNQDYDQFYEIYCYIRRKKGLSDLWNPEDIKRYATLFVAEYKGEIVSGHGYLEDKNNMRSWVIGSKRFEENKEYVTMVANASKLIVWEAMKYAKGKGIREFDMGGYYTGGDTNDSRYTVNLFKKDFGGELTTHYTYRKVYSRILQVIRFVLKRVRQSISICVF